MLSVDVIYGLNIRYSFHYCEFLNKRKNKDVLIFRSFVLEVPRLPETIFLVTTSGLKEITEIINDQFQAFFLISRDQSGPSQVNRKARVAL